ncbi:glycosyltransferase family 39 protein [Mesorhizobium xinjiangense]|uniref:glycosyltransferase family 39 protein n=1 Tax=Mesorhizobium xinjiangense TaxID=2678685 RepID=UPI0018DDBABD|nr:glycosyltransferase family 39 protein [Mesorhizobium xinjiangense]
MMKPSTSMSAPRTRRYVAAIVLGFCALWTLYSSLSRYNLDIHGDMVENFAWGIGWQLGYYKHPPLFSWIAAAWFSVFPRTNVFYFLLSAVNIGVTLLVMWRIALRVLDANQQVVLVACAVVLPPLTFLSTNYNATSAMLPFWALAFLFYLRTIERRSAFDAVLLGAFCALAILAKYHSVVLVLAIAIHGLTDRDVRPILATRLPWLAALTGAIVLVPHAYWMVQNDFETVRYASNQGDGDIASALISVIEFIVAILLYSAPAYLLLCLHRYWKDGLPVVGVYQFRALWRIVEGRALFALMALPVVLTIVLGLATNAELSSLWAIPFFVFLTFAMVLCLPGPLAARYPKVVPPFLALYAVLLLVAAPFVRQETLDVARSNSAMPITTIAEAVQATWRERTGRKLAIVAGEANFLANGTAFYASDRPFAIQGHSFAQTPWVSQDDIARDGAAGICHARKSDGCMKRMAKLFGRIDGKARITVPAVEGAGGPQSWIFDVYFRDPQQAES